MSDPNKSSEAISFTIERLSEITSSLVLFYTISRHYIKEPAKTAIEVATTCLIQDVVDIQTRLEEEGFDL